MDSIRLNRRSGFTLLELLAVIGLAVLMASLLVGASFRFVGNSREAATAATITKVSGIIQDRVRAFQEFDFTDAASAAANSWNVANAAASLYNNASWLSSTAAFVPGSDPIDPIIPALAQVLLRKTRFKKAFPQAFAELDPAQTARLFPTVTPSSLPSSLPTTYVPKYEPGILLYAVLMKGETFGAPTPSDDAFNGAEVKIAPETGNLPCLVDAWGEPLRFYRWPTRLIRCGELDFDGNGTYDDYNSNRTQDPAGWVDTATPTFSPAIRPNAAFRASTPASLLMSNLPPYNNVGGTNYAMGADGAVSQFLKANS